METTKYSVDLSGDKIKTTFDESPYGDSGKTYTGCLDLFNHYILQLKHFQKQPNGDTKHLRNDLEGYQAILDSNSEENARKFMELKDNARRSGTRFRDNLQIVAHMKASGKWVTNDN